MNPSEILAHYDKVNDCQCRAAQLRREMRTRLLLDALLEGLPDQGEKILLANYIGAMGRTTLPGKRLREALLSLGRTRKFSRVLRVWTDCNRNKITRRNAAHIAKVMRD